MRGHPKARAACIAAMVGAASSVAIAQDARVPEVIPPTVEETPPDTDVVTLDRRVFDRLVSDLDSPNLTTRELASERLNVLPGLALDDVLERLADPSVLAPEQLRRLERIAGRLFQSAPKAGLGVQFGRQNAARGVLIEATVDPDRFPAANILMPGDYIAEVRGRPVRSPDDLRAAILSHLPDETMPTVVIREEQRLDLDLPLGNFDLLGRTERIDDRMAHRCVQARLERWGGPAVEPPALGDGVTAGAWASAGDDLEPRSGRRVRTPRGLGVSIGGAARIDPAGTDAGLALGDLVERVDSGSLDPSAMTPEQRLEWHMSLARTYDSLGSQIRTTRMLLSDPSNTAAEAERLEDKVRELVIEQRQVGDLLSAIEELGIDP